MSQVLSTEFLDSRDGQILQLLLSGRHPDHVAEIGRYRRAWTAEDVQRVAAAQAGDTGTPSPASPSVTRWRPPLADGEPDVVVITRAQAKVLTALCRGGGNLAIAGELSLSLDSVKSHVKDLLGCTGRRDRLQLALAAVTGELDVYVSPHGRAHRLRAGARRG